VHTHTLCLECQHQWVVQLDATHCPKCGSRWLDAQYDYERVADRWSATLPLQDLSLWRYRDLLPVDGPNLTITLQEGFTPLLRLHHIHQHVYVKDERYMPTNSFKDRQAAVSVTAMHQQGIRETVLASTGNAAVAYAAYTARAGIKLWVFLTSLVPPEKIREIALYGAEVVKVSGTYDETKQVAAEFAKRKGIPVDQGAKTIPAKESMKTIAFEIAEQLGLMRDGRGWVAPHWYVQAVSGGIGPIGVQKGFAELYRMGLIDKMPRLAIIQAAGCAPMVQAFQAGSPVAEPVVPQTLVHVLATGDPGFGYTLLYNAIQQDGGVMLAVEDGEAFAAMRRLASVAGMSVEPASAVAFAGLDKLVEQNIIQPDETVVINATGHTLPAESHILGDQYDRYVLELAVRPGDDRHQDGLGAALKTLDEQVTTVVVVDDNPNDRRLIRRLLKSHKQYRVYEASDGKDGLRVIRDRQPDLVVCDLNMPEVDGFGLVERLKADPETAHIPVIVVTAKTLTSHDRKRLDGATDSVWQKGGLDTRRLVDRVAQTLGHTPLGIIQSEAERDDHQAQQSSEVDQVIVMIDDNPRDLRLARKMIQDESYHIIEATNGRDGLKAIYNYHPDLIVLDLMLPDVDGFAILETLKQNPDLRDIPVIVVSAKDLTVQESAVLRQQIARRIKKASLVRQQFVDIIKDELS
jgi:threonine synthase